MTEDKEVRVCCNQVYFPFLIPTYLNPSLTGIVMSIV